MPKWEKCIKCGEDKIDYYGCTNKDCENYWQKLEDNTNYKFCPECGHKL